METVRFLARIAALAAALPAAAGTLPEVDAFAAAPPARRALARPAGDFARPGSAVHVEERLGVPTFFLPFGVGDAGRHALAQKEIGAEAAARAHLRDLASLWGLTEADVAGAPLHQVHDTGRGGIVVQLRQEAFGIPVFRDEMRIALDRGHAPVAFAGYLPSVTGLTEPVFALRAKDAVARALAGFGAEGLSASNVESLGEAPGGYERFALAGGAGTVLAGPARARKVLFHLPARLVPAWYLEVDVATAGAGSDLYAVVLSAEDGSLLYRHSLTARDSYAYRVWADASGLKMPQNGPQGREGDPYPAATPDRWQAPFTAPSLVSLESGPISTRDPWLPSGATETNGNNVDAYADVAAPDGFSAGDLRADVTAPGVFDRAFDVMQAPGRGRRTAQGRGRAALLRDELPPRLVLRRGLQRGRRQRADVELREGRDRRRRAAGRGAGLLRIRQRGHGDAGGRRPAPDADVRLDARRRPRRRDHGSRLRGPDARRRERVLRPVRVLARGLRSSSRTTARIRARTGASGSRTAPRWRERSRSSTAARAPSS